MLKGMIRQCYLLLHNLGHRTVRYNPLIPKRINGKKVKYDFISKYHLEDHNLDKKLVADLRQAGIKVDTYQIDLHAYESYLCKAQYPQSYCGAGVVEEGSFREKALEHFVSADLLRFTPGDIFIDIAADRSPFYEIVQQIWDPKLVYRQDLKYKPGIHGSKIGGSATRLPLPENSITKATLHCSLEHFEGTDDMELFQEMSRVLQPGGILCVLPFYLACEYTIHTDPIYNLWFGRGLILDLDAQIRYCAWNNRHSRHYDVTQLQKRIGANLGELNMRILKVENFGAVHPNCYLRFIGLFEKSR